MTDDREQQPAENPADKIKRAKEAMEMGRKLRKGKPAVFPTPRGIPASPNPVEALGVAVDTLRYMKQDNIADWCERGLTWPTT